jgi:uncharacterized protein with HEPN domain
MWRDDAWVLDMLHACQRALRHAKGLTGAAFLSDELRQDAIIRYFRVKLPEVWRIVTEDLAALERALEPLVPRRKE